MKVDLKSISQQFAGVEFFVACVFPKEIPKFDSFIDDLSVVTSQQFWAITSVSPSVRAGLVHKIDNSFIVFRGYEALVGVHSYSSNSELAQIAGPDELKNGVFSFLKVDEASQKATIKNDAFGISPMFYREENGTWFFASHPALIHLNGDSPDLVSWASLMQNGYPLGDRSFYNGIKRFPAGTEMQISAGICTATQWFDFSQLPKGTAEVNEEAIDLIEIAYQKSMNRCLSLGIGAVTLPFSSGFDSRRFFAFMVKNKVKFNAITCQSFNRKNGRDYDIDSVYAPKIADAFGVKCEVIPASSNEQYTEDARKRQRLIGTETSMHAWAMPLMKWLCGRPPSLIFDGLAGDVFGNSSFDIEGLEGNPDRSAAEIVEKGIKASTLRHLSAPINSVQDYREEYKRFVAKFPPNPNQSQLAFLQARTRRGVSPWITMMHPPGHVAVFPYCDIEFANAALTYDPGQKYQRRLQRECLRRFYPEFYDFASSRNLPLDHAPIAQGITLSRYYTESKYVYGEPSIIWSACKYLSFSNKVLLLTAKFIPRLRQRRDWIFRPLLTLLRTQRQNSPFISLNASVRNTKLVQIDPSIEMQIGHQS